jgi:membrane-associated phospholipid phosphatase
MLLIIVAIVGAAAALAGFVASVSKAHPGTDPIDPTAEQRALRRFIARRPKLQRFVGERLDRRRAGGFMLTAGFVIVFAVALGLGLVLSLIHHSDFLTKADTSVSRWGYDHASSRAVDALRWITNLGATPVAAAYLALAAIYDYVRRRNADVFAFVIAVGLGENLLNNGIKLLVRRDRPAVLQLVVAHGFSFPSGHSCAAAACTSAVALILGRDRSGTTRAVLAGLAALVTVAVATSRALLGVHWLSDVLAGATLGWGWFMLVAVVFGGRRQRLGDPVETSDVDAPIDAANAGGR